MIPNGWLDYSPIGGIVEGTRFIAFKVPLKMNLEQAEQRGVKLEDVLNIDILKERIPNLGLIIDLTNTRKYYNPQSVTDLSIEYRKIFVPGHEVPHQDIFSQFMNTVTDFLQRNAANDKLIGVHCTHGLNRTGLMICSYMIQEYNIEAEDAISRFEKARGHKMERNNYLQSLREMTPMISSPPKDCTISPCIIENNLRTLSTQTDPGLWLDSTNLTKKSIKRRRKSNNTQANTITDVQSIKGVLNVHVKGRDLIPDGRGGYVLQVDVNDIVCTTSPSSKSHQSFTHPTNRSIHQSSINTNERNSHQSRTYTPNRPRNQSSTHLNGTNSHQNPQIRKYTSSNQHNGIHFNNPWNSSVHRIDRRIDNTNCRDNQQYERGSRDPRRHN